MSEGQVGLVLGDDQGVRRLQEGVQRLLSAFQFVPRLFFSRYLLGYHARGLRIDRIKVVYRRLVRVPRFPKLVLDTVPPRGDVTRLAGADYPREVEVQPGVDGEVVPRGGRVVSWKALPVYADVRAFGKLIGWIEQGCEVDAECGERHFGIGIDACGVHFHSEPLQELQRVVLRGFRDALIGLPQLDITVAPRDLQLLPRNGPL